LLSVETKTSTEMYVCGVIALIVTGSFTFAANEESSRGKLKKLIIFKIIRYSYLVLKNSQL